MEGKPEEQLDLNSYRRKKKPDHKKSKIDRTKKERIIRTVLAVCMVGIICVCLIVGGFLVYVFNFIDRDMGIDLEEYKLNGTTTIFVQNKEGDWQEYQRLHGSENRIWIPLEEMPKNLQNAFIAIEDKRFYSHGGVDWKRTFSAFANMFFHFYSSNQGGSTITQQLVKNLTGDKQQDWKRKVREIMRARELEINESKDTILECYLNVVSMANGISGVEVASNFYFNKSACDLSLAECASLASITKNPESFRPDIYPENNERRRKIVLEQMLDQGYITKEQYDEAMAEEITIVADPANLNELETNSYFVDALIDDVVKGLIDTYHYEKADAEMMFYNGGYQIYSTMNPQIQSIADSVFTNSKAYGLKAKDGATMQGAITVMDYAGHIVAMEGGIGQKEGNRGFNRATMSARQPGSTMKPISAYAPAIDTNLITYSTLVQDKYTTYGNWYPKNWYGGFWGNITIQYALERSVNTIPVYLVNEMTPQFSYRFLCDSLGITTLNAADSNLAPLGMGGTNGGLNTTESAAAFAIFGNQGKFYKPTTYYYVTDSKGNKVLEYSGVGEQAIGPDTATVMNHMLQTVVYGANGTGAGARGYIPNMKIYAKTGTSDATNDLWFVGGSPYYVASCWCGYDQNETIPSAVIAQKMWGAVMSEAHKGLEVKQFEDSIYASCRYYCRETGLVATKNCPHVALGYYKNSYLPVCSVHGGNILAPVSGGSETMTGESGIVQGKTNVTISIAPPPEPEKPEESEESETQSESSAETGTQQPSSESP